MSTEKVPFRLIQMSCCNILICWVNARRPNYCPECGKRIIQFIPKLEWDNRYSPAWLKVENHDRAYYVIAEKKSETNEQTSTGTSSTPSGASK